MLVLTRKVNETIVIGENIEVMVVDVRGKQVKLGINAPHFIPVHRQEVYLAVKQENLEAVSAATVDAAAALARAVARSA